MLFKFKAGQTLEKVLFEVAKQFPRTTDICKVVQQKIILLALGEECDDFLEEILEWKFDQNKKKLCIQEEI